jgi:hypothetical protein
MSGAYKKRAHREFCGLCHRMSSIGFWVPDECWAAVVHASRINDIHCLPCFIARADEQLIPWDREIKLFPVSLSAHLTATSLRHLVTSGGALAQGIEAGTATTGTGVVHESPVAEGHAPMPCSPTSITDTDGVEAEQ